MDSPIDTLQSAERKERVDIAIALVVVLLAGIMLWTYGLDHLRSAKQTDIEGTSILLSNKMGLDRVVVEDRAYAPLAVVPAAKALITKPTAIAQRNVTGIQRQKNMPASASITVVDSSASEPLIHDVLDTLATGDEARATEIEGQQNQLDSVSEESTPTVVPDYDTEVVDKSCVIIVGAYGSSNNARKMKSRLVSAGYSVFEIPYKTLTRIGVYSPCKIDALSASLKQIRRDFARDATVLELEN